MYDINEFVDDLTLDIYEAERYGEITESERDAMLYIVERNKLRGGNSSVLRLAKIRYDKLKVEKDKIEKRLSELERRGYDRDEDIYKKNANKLIDIRDELKELQSDLSDLDTYKGNKSTLNNSYQGSGEFRCDLGNKHAIRNRICRSMKHRQTSDINKRINKRARAKMESTIDDFNEAYGLYDY